MKATASPSTSANTPTSKATAVSSSRLPRWTTFPPGAGACWRGAPPASSAPAVLQESGGLVGAIIAAPLARLLSTWGAATLFAGVLFLGTLISTRTSVAAVGRGIASMGRLAGSALTAPPRLPPPPPAPPEVVEPVDSGEAPPRRRGRRRAEPAPDADDTVEVMPVRPGDGAGKIGRASCRERVFAVV